MPTASLDRTTCEILTPEGVPLTFLIATVGDRLSAFMLDLGIILLATLCVLIPLLICVMVGGGETIVALCLVFFFVLRNFYFIIFEIRGSGTTYGKRKLGLRVIARDGGPLTADMIFARNLTRDIELFLPLTALTAPESLIPRDRSWGLLVALGWIFVLAILPLFSRKRLRCGDIIAGTVVVVDPRAALLPDLAEHEPSPVKRIRARDREEERPEEPRYKFSAEQLGVYGIKELQVLEDLFRRLAEGRASRESMTVVCEKIKKKIRWSRLEWGVDPVMFLRDFYRAQRAHLESGLLLGKRKEGKS